MTKLPIVMGLAGAVGAMVAWFLFTELQEKRERARQFRAFVEEQAIWSRFLLVTPHVLNGTPVPVQGASYQLDDRSESIEMSIGVLRSAGEKTSTHWIWEASKSPRLGTELTRWRLVDFPDLRPGAESNGLTAASPKLVFPYQSAAAPRIPLLLRVVGKEIVRGPTGEINAERKDIYAIGPTGRERRFLVIWTNPDIPWRIVQAKWRHQRIQLLGTPAAIPPFPVPADDLPIPERGKERAQFFTCSRCHEPQRGGLDIHMLEPLLLVGRHFDIPDVTYHWREAGIPIDPVLGIRVLSTTRTAVAPYVRVEDKVGNMFQVAPNAQGGVSLRHDDEYGRLKITSDGNLLQLRLEALPFDNRTPTSMHTERD